MLYQLTAYRFVFQVNCFFFFFFFLTSLETEEYNYLLASELRIRQTHTAAA